MHNMSPPEAFPALPNIPKQLLENERNRLTKLENGIAVLQPADRLRDSPRHKATEEIYSA